MAGADFQLFSDQLKPTSRQQQYIDTVGQLVNFLKSSQLYGREHNQVEAGKKAVLSVFTELFTKAQCLILLQINDEVFVQDCSLDMSDSRAEKIAEWMNNHQLRKVIIWKGVGADEIVSFAELLAQKPADVVDSGGFSYLLSKKRCKHVEVRVRNYSAAGEGVSASGAKGAVGGHRLAAWQSGLMKIGIGEEEFLNYLQFKATPNKLSSRELRLTVPVLTDPKALAELVLFMGAGEADGAVDPEALLGAIRRVENVMLMHSGVSDGKAQQLLQQATRLFDGELRLSMLHYCSQVMACGRPITNLNVFDFTPEEKLIAAEQLIATGSELQPLRYLGLTSAMREGLAGRHPAKAGEVQAAASMTLGNLHTQAPHLKVSSDSDARVQVRFENLRLTLEQGYMFALADLMASGFVANDIESRLFKLLDHYFDSGNQPVIYGLLTTLAKSPNAGQKGDLFWQLLADKYVDRIMQMSARRCAEHSVAEAEFLAALHPFLPKRATDYIVKTALEDMDPAVHRTMVNVLAYRQVDLREQIAEYLESEVVQWRMNAYDLLAAYNADWADKLIVRGLDDPDPAVQLGVTQMIGTLGRIETPTRLIEIAEGEGPGKTRIVRLAAIKALGSLKSHAAIPVLESIVATKSMFAAKKSRDVRGMAGLALWRIGSDSAKSALDRHLTCPIKAANEPQATTAPASETSVESEAMAAVETAEAPASNEPSDEELAAQEERRKLENSDTYHAISAIFDDLDLDD
jgi:HEAT repeat protein